MKKIILLLILSSLSGFSQVGVRSLNGNATNLSVLGGLTNILGTNNFPVRTWLTNTDYIVTVKRTGAFWIPSVVALTDLLGGTNNTIFVGNDTYFSTRPGSKAQLYFNDNHGTGRGYVALGALSGDVVISPSLSSGVFQMGGSGASGSHIYLQYASDPGATPTGIGFSHPLQFRNTHTNAATGGGYIFHYPGIVSFPITTNNASELGQLRFYARVPYWTLGNNNPDSPTTTGFESFRADTNILAVAPGVQFTGNGGGITNVNTYGYDADAEAYFTRASIADATERRAYTVFFQNLKAANIYTNFDAIYFFPKEASYGMNAVSSSFDMTFSGGPVRNPVGGLIFDGVDDYANTGYNPASGTKKYVQDSASIVFFNGQSTAPATGAYIYGATDASLHRTALTRNTTLYQSHGFNNNNGSGAGIVTADYSGVVVGTRTASTVMKVFYRNLGAATDATASTGVPNDNIYLGARSSSGAPFNYAQIEAKLFMIGSGLSDAQVVSLTNAIVTLRSNLSLVVADAAFAMTNFIEGAFYTNATGKNIHVKADIWKVPVAVSGYVGVDIRVGNGATMTRVTGQSDPTFLAATLLGASTNSISTTVSNTGVYCFTNISAGALNTAGLVPGTGNITTY